MLMSIVMGRNIQGRSTISLRAKEPSLFFRRSVTFSGSQLELDVAVVVVVTSTVLLVVAVVVSQSSVAVVVAVPRFPKRQFFVVVVDAVLVVVLEPQTRLISSSAPRFLAASDPVTMLQSVTSQPMSK